MEPKRSVIEGWPALLSSEMAARYLSVDEITLTEFAIRWGIDPVELETDSPRWRRSDLDRLIRRLPTTAIADVFSRPRQVGLDDTTIERIASAVALRLGARGRDSQRSLVSIKDAGDTLGVARSTIYRLINEGQLSTRRIGRRTLIPMADIDAILTEG